MDLAAALDLLHRGTDRVVSTEELERKLGLGRPLRVKLGLDPSAPDIHLGHTVVLRKLRQFQDLGHEVALVIGDFTGRIGDPSGKSEARRQLSDEEVRANAATYERQVAKVLDPDRTRIVFNASWLAPLDFAAVVALASRVTVARMLERDDFADRVRAGRPVHLHEFFYPLMQGFDSVALRADVELGGTDQTFNLMMAREIQRSYGQEPEVAVITPIVVGLDGVQKMSKSLNNYVGVDEAPEAMYGKLMSLPDALIRTYFEYFTDEPLPAVEAAVRDGPRAAKAWLARSVVAQYRGEAAAAAAQAEFERIFVRRELPTDVAEAWLSGVPESAVDLLMAAGLAPSRSEARRLVTQGGVEVDGARLTDPAARPVCADGSVVRVGKRRFVRLRLAGG